MSPGSGTDNLGRPQGGDAQVDTDRGRASNVREIVAQADRRGLLAHDE